LAYWRERSAVGLIPFPYVALVKYPFGQRRVFGATRGEVYHFRSEYVDAMPDDVVQDLIAHELAHGVQYADGIRCVRQYSDGRADFVCADGSPRGGRLDIELDANEMMDCDWGFDSESVDRWALAAGITKVIMFADPVKALEARYRRMDRGR
jgi:hypothetical protein